ncbi:MAG TPA: ROK family protein [Acidimicrobiia bacterium]|nr:ROK family protein [Acidimicrobiia bacterium]
MGARLGIDVGGSGIKGAVVDLEDGSLVSERVKIATPEPVLPAEMATMVAELVSTLGYDGAVGIGFPAVVVDGTVWTANNIHRDWIGVNAQKVFTEATGVEVEVINDADAAALGEARYGAARGVGGLVILLTFGSGIGSGLLLDGRLIPNVELGQLELDGHRPAESHFSASARKRDDVGWDEWGDRVNRFLTHVNALFSPRLILVSGGVARKWEKFAHRIHPDLPAVRAEAANNAGIVGAATLVE